MGRFLINVCRAFPASSKAQIGGNLRHGCSRYFRCGESSYQSLKSSSIWTRTTTHCKNEPSSGSQCGVCIKIKIERTIIFGVDLYGYETWYLTLMEERRTRVFENNVLREMSGPKRKEVTGDWRRLHK